MRMTPGELARLMRDVLPVRGRVEITAGDPRSLEPGTDPVVEETDEQDLTVLTRAAVIDAGGAPTDLNVKTWVWVPAAARGRHDVVRAVLRVWSACVRRFVERTSEEDHPWLASPEFFEPGAAYQEPLTTDEAVLRDRLEREFDRRLEVLTTTNDGWGE